MFFGLSKYGSPLGDGLSFFASFHSLNFTLYLRASFLNSANTSALSVSISNSCFISPIFQLLCIQEFFVFIHGNNVLFPPLRYFEKATFKGLPILFGLFF